MEDVDNGVSKPLATVNVGDLCIVEVEGVWYRGTVNKLDRDDVEVTTMDEG